MAVEKDRRPRGRPRAYDEGTALDAALKTFWGKGYGGTSVDDLAAEMNMSKPSVYAAFGNKQAVYEAAVNHYVATIGSGYLKPLMERPTLREGLLGLYSAQVDVVTGKHGPLGCVVACTLPAEAGDSPEARNLLSEVIAQLDSAIGTRIRAAQAAGELPKDADPATMAQVVTSGMLSLSIRARAGSSRRALTKLARVFVDMVAPERRTIRDSPGNGSPGRTERGAKSSKD